MILKIANIASLATAAAVLALMTAAAPADAKDWRRSVDRHYDAVEQTKWVPKGDNPQWGFSLDTVVADMAWRQRTARMLRHAPKPNSDLIVHEPEQLADRPEQPTLRFAF